MKRTGWHNVCRVVAVVALVVSIAGACGDDKVEGSAGSTSSTAGPATSVGEPDVVTVGFFPAHPTYAGFYVAMEKGFYEDEGVELKLEPIFGGEDRLAAAHEGAIDIAMMDAGASLLDIEKSEDLQIVAVKESVNSVATIALAESGIDEPADWAGRSFGSNPGSLEFELLPVMGELNDFDASTVSIQTLDFGAMLPALISGSVDTVTAFYVSNAYEFEQAAAAAGKDTTIVRWSQFGLDTYGDVFVAGNEVRERGDVLERFLRATMKGFQYAADHPDEVVGIVQKYDDESTPEAIEVNWGRTVELLTDGSDQPLGHIDGERMERTREIVFDALGETPSRPIEEFFTNEYLSDIRLEGAAEGG